jgi:hypothetical protein
MRAPDGRPGHVTRSVTKGQGKPGGLGFVRAAW